MGWEGKGVETIPTVTLLRHCKGGNSQRTDRNCLKSFNLSPLCQGLSLPRTSYYRNQIQKSDVPGNKTLPANTLSDESRQTILDLLHSERFIDCTPYQVLYTLLDEGHYYGSIRTFYRSNDNPFSESQFKTLKYCPQFPNRFKSIQHAETFCQKFFIWYNQEHYYSGIL